MLEEKLTPATNPEEKHPLIRKRKLRTYIDGEAKRPIQYPKGAKEESGIKLAR